MPTTGFHPAVRAWFDCAFDGPTEAQRRAWPAIKSGANTLIAAPTGSGKTLAAFLAAIDDLVWHGLEGDLFGALPDATQIVYVSPLRALSNDIHRNLEAPLAGIRAELEAQGMGDLPIRTMVRTGDTPRAERESMRRRPPHILVTTPESLYILLTSDSGRRMLATTRTLIVDEIHALAGNKRGAHLALSMERLEGLCGAPLTRIGLSATQKPVGTVARFLTGAREGPCTVVDAGHTRDRDLAIELTASPLEAVMSGEGWAEIHERLAGLIESHRTTLVFVNTRRQAERIAKALSERLGEKAVTSHHGSLAREHRLDAEKRLKAGGLRALVATASLELGIDIGDVDLVCQIGSPRAIGTFLQRVGRSGHAVGAVPKGRLFPATRDELVECVALLDAVARGELDALAVPAHPLDVLAQQIVAETACAEQEEGVLYGRVRRAWPYRELPRGTFDAVVAMLAEGFSTRRGRRSAWIHRDAVHGRLRARRGARLTALLNGGAIPDLFDYDVILQPQGLFIGTLNEDFAFESLAGDIFALGNTSYRILRTETGKVHVEDARGQPPNIPFWFGEAPGRSDELSAAVSRLRATVEAAIDRHGLRGAAARLPCPPGVTERALRELVDYLGDAHAALGALPTHERIVMERFFDEAGDQHLVIHSPWGSRVNRAWGLALRKRFCRKFNFELQAAALEDTIVLSLGSTHSFPLEEVARYLKTATVRGILIQAMLDAPVFPTHWRWNATIALAVQRTRASGRVPPQFQRMDAEDLVAVIFPDQLACLENVAGDRELPDHPLVNQTVHDCLHGVMDIDGLERLLARIEAGEVQVLARDLAGPSPLCGEVLAARPYAFLDGAPAEERRTRTVRSRRFTDPADAADLGRLDEAAIGRVRVEAWPCATTPDELHDALLWLGGLTREEGEAMSAGRDLLGPLAGQERATALTIDCYGGPAVNHDRGGVASRVRGPHRQEPVHSRPRGSAGKRRWVCAERLGQWLALHPDATLDPPVAALADPAAGNPETALMELVRSRLEGTGPVTVPDLAGFFGVAACGVETALLSLEQEGFAMRGRFSQTMDGEQWCERGLLARIHRQTLRRQRDAVTAVPAADFMRFLFRWHRVDNPGDTPDGEAALDAVLEQLEGFEAAAVSWEADILPARLAGYTPDWLDRVILTGRRVWVRLGMPATRGEGRPRRMQGSLRHLPVVVIARQHLGHWAGQGGGPPEPSAVARRVLERLATGGASFFEDLAAMDGLLPMQVEEALAELAAAGLVTCDSFAGLRALMPAPGRRARGASGRQRSAGGAMGTAGRWSLLRAGAPEAEAEGTAGLVRAEFMARALLRRYGVVFRTLLEREALVPRWGELLYALRRLEARGEIRGGRFVDGFAGEQFALPEAAGLLRRVHGEPADGRWVCIGACDPLNLAGVATPGPRVPAVAANRVLYRDGIPVAELVGGRVNARVTLDGDAQWEVHQRLLRRRLQTRPGKDGVGSSAAPKRAPKRRAPPFWH